eukprot:5624199-Pyramimonas_sp.AAC.1
MVCIACVRHYVQRGCTMTANDLRTTGSRRVDVAETRPRALRVEIRQGTASGPKSANMERSYDRIATDRLR